MFSKALTPQKRFYLSAAHPDHTTCIGALQDVAGKAVLAQKYCWVERLSLLPEDNQVHRTENGPQVSFMSSISQENKTLHKGEVDSEERHHLIKNKQTNKQKPLFFSENRLS